LTWTDIHSHILPGFDDGASSEQEFLEMARKAVEGGTSVMVATPHYDHESPAFELPEITEAVVGHNSLLQERNIPLRLVPGAEVRVNAGLLQSAMKNGGMEGFCLGNSEKYILVDMPITDMPLAATDAFFHLQLHGMVPILAHPERNRHLVEHPAVLRDLVERGIEMQVNSGSLEGIFGKAARRTAMSLLNEGASRLVASDAHGLRARTPDLSRAARVLCDLLGEEAARLILEVNPGLVLDGKELTGLTRVSARRSEPSRGRFWRKPR
jgi:protein-tyrosine phosphatase